MNNLQTLWAELAVSSLADAGVRHAVVSPGSRSVPLVFALAGERRIETVSCVDERAAAFFALGQARITGAPTLLVCTSGSAAAHYLPAIIEASEARIPVIACTADRPLELQQCGAPQTMDQMKVFGAFTRRYFEIGTPEDRASALRALRRVAAQAVHASTGPDGGPVHMNMRFRKPLEPVQARSEPERQLHARVEAVRSMPISAPRRGPARVETDVLDVVAEACSAAPRGVIVAGPAPVAASAQAESVLALARATGYPLLTEASSQLRFVEVPPDIVVWDSFEMGLRTPKVTSDIHPECVIQLGAPLTSAAMARAMGSEARVRRFVVADSGWPDPSSSAEHLLFGDIGPIAAALAQRVSACSRATDVEADNLRWRERIGRIEAASWRAIDDVLFGDDRFLSEGAVARSVLEAVGAGGYLMLGNSLPIRHADAFGRRSAAPGLRVLTQRGVNGIDGLVAGACGSASVGKGPVALLIGDVSFLHDVSALALARNVRVPLVIVVLRNGGGRIFEHLPFGSHPQLTDAVANLTYTPFEFDLTHAAALFDVTFHRVADPKSLSAALSEAMSTSQTSIVEARVPQHGALELYRRVSERMESECAP